MLVEGTVTLGQLAERIARGTTFASAEIEGIVALLVDELSGSLAEGYSVRIEGLGAFTAKLAYRRDIEPEECEGGRRNAASLRISGIAFRPDKRLIGATAGACHLKRKKCPGYVSPSKGRDGRWEVAKAFLRSHGMMRVKEYQSLVALSPTAARMELRAFAEEGRLERYGSRAQLIYLLPK
jgi:putative DNA-binding protein